MHGKTVLITGCSSGIGRSLAREAARRGMTVYATARRPETLHELGDGDIHALPLDVTDADSIDAAVHTIAARSGRIDVLLNNAGQALFGPLAEVPLERVGNLLATNVTGQLAVCQAVIPLMSRAGAGCIANVGSIMGVFTTPFVGAYSASKAALHLASDALRMELAPLGIDVVVVQPGAVKSSIADNALADDELAHYAREESLYRSVHRHILRRARASQDNPMDSEEFARRVWEQLLRSPPPAVIREGGGSGAFQFLSRLPRRARDALFSRHFGLRDLRRPAP